MNRVFALLAALALAGGSMPLHAAALTEGAGEPAPSSDGDIDPALAAYDHALLGGRFSDALAAIAKFAPDNNDGKAVLATMRAAALIGLKRDSEARALIAESEKLSPQAAAENSGLIFYGSVVAGRMDFAADALDKLIDRAPDVAREIDTQYMGFFMRDQPKGESRRNEDRRIALARIGYGTATGYGDAFARDAVEILLKRGDTAGAAAVLPYIEGPEPIEDMLIDRRFAALWPQLQQIAGGHLENVRKSSADGAERAFEASPEDHAALQYYANALRHAGRLDDAIALRAKLPATVEAMSSADEQMGWAVNNVALALHEAGKGDEADQLFAMLNDAPMPKEYWRVSMKINRVELLVLDGKFQQALPLIDAASKVDGSPYAYQLVRRLRYCTLSRLGRTEEATKFLPELLAHASDAPGPTIDGLLCAGQIDQAEQVALTALKNPDEDRRVAFENDFVRQLQRERLTSDDPSVWQTRWQELRARPAIGAEFDRLGRDMPESLRAPQPKLAATK